MDDLHERAGSSKVLHLHGELLKVRSTKNPEIVKEQHEEIHLGDLCENGSQWRPHTVWFGEEVPTMDQAVELVLQADIFLIVGTSLLVYPATGLKDMAPDDASVFLVDPNPEGISDKHITIISQKTTEGVPMVANLVTTANT